MATEVPGLITETRTSIRKIDEVSSLWKNNKMSTPPYQRNPTVWSDKQRQELIRTIFARKNLPQFFVQEYRKYDITRYHLLEGQQRIETIVDFMDNKIELDKKHNPDFAGKTWKTLESDMQEQFKDYSLIFIELKSPEEELMRDLYVRINSGGTNLNSPEKRHANYHKHEFNQVTEEFAEKNNGFYLEQGILKPGHIDRMYNFEITAELFVLALNEAQGSGVSLDKFYRQYEIFDEKAKAARRVSTAFRMIKRIFPNSLKGTDYDSLNGIYALVGGLIATTEDCVIDDKKLVDVENDLTKFMDEVKNRGQHANLNTPVSDYWLSLQEGTRSKANRTKRVNAIKKHLWKYATPKDGQRQFTEAQRREIWQRSKGHKCKVCNRDVQSYEDFEADHVVPHSKGGKTLVENGQITHKDCNRAKSDK